MTQGPILTAAIIGAGNRGATHLATVSTLRQHFRLVGVCDAREERRQWATETYGVPAFEHPVALLDAVSPEVVGVVVPPDAHHLVTAVAAARGAHIITETPIATTLAMADHMLAAAQRHNVLLEVSENVWRWPHERLKRLVVEQGPARPSDPSPPVVTPPAAIMAWPPCAASSLVGRFASGA